MLTVLTPLFLFAQLNEWDQTFLETNMDVLSIDHSNGYLKASNVWFGSNRETVKEMVTDTKIYTQRSRLMMSTIVDGKDENPVILYLHGGGFVHGDRFEIPTSLVITSQALDVTLLSMDYTLLIQSNLLKFRKDVDDAIQFVHTHYPNRKLILSGSSAGANIVLDAIKHRGATADALLLFNPLVCVDSYNSDALQDDDTCWDPDEEDPNTARSLLLNQGLCFDSIALSMPTFVTVPDPDFVVPDVQYDRFEKNLVHDTQEMCRDSSGLHGEPATLLGGCITKMLDWIESNFDLKLGELERTTKYLLPEMLNLVSTVVRPFVTQDDYCRQMCLYTFTDSLELKGFGC